MTAGGPHRGSPVRARVPRGRGAGRRAPRPWIRSGGPRPTKRGLARSVSGSRRRGRRPRRRRRRPQPRAGARAGDARRAELPEGRRLPRRQHLPGEHLPADRHPTNIALPLLPRGLVHARSSCSTGRGRGPDGYTVLAPFYWHFWSARRSRVTHVGSRAGSLTASSVDPRDRAARSFAIWPLFYASNNFGWAIPLLGSFTLRDPDAKKSGGAVGFLYWWKRGPDRAFDLAFPLFVSSRTPAHAFTFALPLNFYWRNDDDANILALPLFYANSHKTGSSFYTWLGYHHREGPEHSGSVALALLVRRQRQGRSRATTSSSRCCGASATASGGTTIVPPLVWSFRGPKSSTTVVVPVRARRREAQHVRRAVPALVERPRPRQRATAFKLAHPLLLLARERARQGVRCW